MRDQHAAWLLAMVMLLAGGCRKEEKGSPPEVEILLPGQSTTVAVPGSLLVRVAVSDDGPVESVSFMLADHNGVPIVPPVLAEVGSTSATVERILPVTDERIASGNYSLIVRVVAGDDQRQAFRSVNVLEAPLRLRALFIVPPTGESGTITRIDSTGAASAWGAVNAMQGAAVNSYSQHFYHADGTHGPLIASPTANSSSTWQVPNANGENSPFFRGIGVDPTDRKLYVGSNDGFIRGYLGQGGQVFTAQAQPGFRPYRSVVVGDHLLTEQRGIAFPERRVAVHTLAAGAFLEHWALELDVVGLFARSEASVLLFGELDGDGVVRERFVATGGGSDLRTFAGAPIRAVARLSSTAFALALPGEVVRYDLASNGALPIAAVAADALAFEAATGTLYIATGNQLTMVDPFDGNTTGTATLPGPIGGILPLLNR